MAGPPRIPVARDISHLPVARFAPEPLTNIGAADIAAQPAVFSPLQTGKRLDQINPDPLWISRWQDSATPIGQPRPWVKGYRWWEANVPFQTWGPDQTFRIDIMWADHRHAYIGIPLDLWREFTQLTTSVGQWFHRRILGPHWKRGDGALFNGFPL